MADNGDMQLAAVVLYDFGNDAYVDTRAMFDYAFDNFEKVALNDQEKPEEIEAYTDMDSYVVLPAGVDFADLDREIEITDEQNHTGTVTYTYQGQNVGSADVVLTREYVSGETQANGETVQVNENSAETDSFPFIAKLIIGVVAAVVLLFLVLFAVLKYRQIQRRRRTPGKETSIGNLTEYAKCFADQKWNRAGQIILRENGVRKNVPRKNIIPERHVAEKKRQEVKTDG